MMTEFREFAVKDVFNVSGTKSLDAGKLNFSDNGINFVGRTAENNGVQGKIQMQSFAPNEANTITATVIGNYKYVKFQNEPYYCSQNINKLILREKYGINLNYKIALYFITLIRKFVEIYNGQQSGYKLEELQNFKMVLPVISGTNKIDFQYMEDRVKALDQDRVKALANYLTVTGLNDYQLTDEDKKILEYEPEFHDFNLASSYTLRGKINNVSENGLFDIGPTKKKINANIVKLNGNYPYVARGTNNNGIRGYVDYDTKYLNPDRTISFGQDTATLYYQPIKYFTGDKIQIFKLNSKFERNLNSRIAQYLITVTRKLFSNFSWGQSSFAIDKIAYLKIALPVKQGTTEIDFDYMEKYIKAIQKITIKNVVKYKDKVINETKKVIK